MIFSPELLIVAAKKAGIKVPQNLQKYNKDDYLHWEIFCKLQLCLPMPTPTSHFINAKILAEVPINIIKYINYKEVAKLGFHVGTPINGK